MIIGISGKALSGKDETGKIIMEYYKEKKFVVKKFADKLKEITAILLGIQRSDLESQEYKASVLPKDWWIYKFGEKIIPYVGNEGKLDEHILVKTTPRWLLQNIGTDCFRKLIHPDVWVISTFADYDESKNVVITDVRFKNEADAIKKRGGIVIRIKRPTDDYSITHPSETALDDYPNFDAVINNDGTIDDLKEKVINLLTTLLNESKDFDKR